MLVGDGMQKSKLENIVKKNKPLYGEGRVLFTGQIPYEEVQDYYAAADVIVTASQSETQCLGVWEAHAAGKPVVAIRAPGISDYVKDNVNGLLANQLAELKTYIRWLNGDRGKLAELSRGAREISEKRKREPSSAEKLADVYQRLF